MKPLTYLGFTILSVFMQFCVMEFIHERFQLKKDSKTLNETVKKNGIIKKINQKPHALFYRTESEGLSKGHNYPQSVKYSNSSLEVMQILTSTDISTTSFDMYYDENNTVTDDFLTTESYLTDSEFDNVTEITFLDKGISSTTSKPSLSKKVVKKECFCDLLYKNCDINCCCDSDCTEEERSLFINCVDNCEKSVSVSGKNTYLCNTYLSCGNSVSTGIFNDLICVVKVNLPDKQVKSNYMLDQAALNATYKWNVFEKSDISSDFQKNKYEYGDIIWLIQNDSIFSMYLPMKVGNNYCTGRKPIKFFINENIKCNVKFEELYALSALKTLEETKIISVTESSMNNTVLNCSSLHCTNWTILVCDNTTCGDYNHIIHAPTCAKNHCNNLPIRVEYSIYYYDSRITNASVKLYMNKIRMNVQLILQEVIVKWYLGNETIDDIIQLSGNPGYMPGLPIITSSAANNHTNNFFNRTYGKPYIAFPINDNGQCVWSNIRNKTLLFGFNTRSKCRLSLQQNISKKNATMACQSIQNIIKEYAGLNQKLFISPYGNPRDVKDDMWVLLEVNDRKFLYGEYQSKHLSCYNLVTRYAFVIAFADISTKNKAENRIVKVTVDTQISNLTFSAADLSTVLTLDVRFVDISRPIREFAKGPHININLPNDFFFHYPSNKCCVLGSDIIMLSTLVLLINK